MDLREVEKQHVKNQLAAIETGRSYLSSVGNFSAPTSAEQWNAEKLAIKTRAAALGLLPEPEPSARMSDLDAKWMELRRLALR